MNRSAGGTRCRVSFCESTAAALSRRRGARVREMPVTYHIDKTRGLIYTDCVGNVTPDEVFEHFRVLERDPECPARLDVLLDLNACTSVPDRHQLRGVSGQIGRIRDKVRFEDCAIVAGSDVLFGMSRMFEVFASAWFREVRVCRARDEAESWLSSRPRFAKGHSAE